MRDPALRKFVREEEKAALMGIYTTSRGLYVPLSYFTG